MPENVLQLLVEACEKPEEESLRRFFRALREISVVVFEQNSAISNSISAPQLLNILALPIEDQFELGCIPFFLSKEDRELWSTAHLPTRTMPFLRIIELLPDSWEMTLNPASQYGKDFSHWELLKIKEGNEGIEEVIQDILHSQEGSTFSLSNLLIEEGPLGALIERVMKFQNELPAAESAFVFKMSNDSGNMEQITVALLINDDSKKSEYESKLQDECSQFAIGSDSFYYWVLHINEKSPQRELLRTVNPLWSR